MPEGADKPKPPSQQSKAADKEKEKEVAKGMMKGMGETKAEEAARKKKEARGSEGQNRN